jgi:hypothetical protein
MRVLTDSFRIYLGDYDDVTPGDKWMDAMLPYVKDESNYAAPGVGNPSAGIFGFAYNEALINKPYNSFPDRSIIPLFFDSTVTNRNATSNTSTMPVPGRYDGKNVISCLDGFQEGYDILEESMKRLKMLGTATLIYAGDHDDFLLAAGWMDDIEPYVKASRPFHSPIFDSDLTKFGYALNQELAGIHGSAIESPSQTIMLFDSTNLSKSAIEPTSTRPSPGRYSGYNTQAMADSSTRFVF